MPQAPSFSFDRSAEDFDRRAGLPPAAVAEIVAALARLAERSGGRAADGPFLDLGAGTGEIGDALGRRLAAGRYLALDLSLRMLGVFRRRSATASMLRADAAKTWPLADGRLDTIFASRAVHLLEPGHFCREARRTLHGRGRVVLGGVRREPASVRSSMRRRLHELLAEHGVEGRRRKKSWRVLEERFSDFSAERESVSRWPVEERPADSLKAWRTKPGLAGRALPIEMRRQVLSQLERWAVERFQDLEAPRGGKECYELLVLQRAA